MRVLIWGAGSYCDYVIRGIRAENEILALIDSDPQKQGTMWNQTIPLISPEEISSIEYDMIVISVINFSSIKEKCREMLIPRDKVLCYWEDEAVKTILNSRMERILEEKRRGDIYRARLDSAPFEWGLKYVPQILSAKLCLEEIINHRYSLCRFGDGEFNIMLESGKPWFQSYDKVLKKRLKEVLNNKNKRILIGIAQNFQHLDDYTEAAADEIRLYMEGEKREAILGLLGRETIYYDAYVTRPYMIYRNKEYGKEIFQMFQKIWKNRHLLIVEGRYARFGVGNDLLQGAEIIRRILCPATNAWNRYDEILGEVLRNVTKDCVVCISLGPTATILAYDLALQGIQAIDIGQLDNEYEWFLRGVNERTEIEGKMVAEVAGHPIPSEVCCSDYREQIVSEIS